MTVLAPTAWAVESKLVYQSLGEGTLGLHPTEVKGLQTIFDEHKILDLDRSGLTELSGYLDRLRERLTTAIEGTGEYYPEYRISVLASEEKSAFVYKFRIPGQKFYRGHVYLSSGLLKGMLETLEREPSTATDEELAQLMIGVEGVIEHEFSHPKQDELVKWEWRESHDRSQQSHGQADEMATDLMAIRLARKARLDPKGILVGLELLFGHKPRKGKYVGRTAGALMAVHPEEKLRVNIIRGGLVQQRREEGKGEIEPIPYDSAALREDLGQIILNDSEESRIARIRAAAADRGESFLIRFLNEMLSGFSKAGDDFGYRSKVFKAYLDWFPLLEQVLDEVPELNEKEQRALIDFFSKVKEMGVRGFSDGLWMFDGSGSGGVDPATYPASLVRKAQHLYESSKLFKNPALQAHLESELKERFWDFAMGDDTKSLHYLGVILPRAFVAERIYAQTLRDLDRFSPEWQGKHLTTMLYGFRLMGGDASVEIQAVRKLREVTSLSKEAMIGVAKALGNFFPNWRGALRPQYLERFLAAGPRSPELVGEWAAFFEAALRDPGIVIDSDLFEEMFPSSQQTASPYLWELLHWNLVPGDQGRKFTAQAKVDASLATRLLIEIVRTDAWRKKIRESLEAGATGGGMKDPVLRLIPRFLSATHLAFNASQREAVLEAILGLTDDAQPDSELFKGRLRFETGVIGSLDKAEPNFTARRLMKLSELVRSRMGTDLLTGLDRMLGSPSNTAKILFGNNGHKTVAGLEALRKAGQLDETTSEEAYKRYFFGHKPERGHAKAPESLEKSTAYRLWKTQRPNAAPEETLALIKRLIATFEVKTLDAGANDALIETEASEDRALAQAGITISPNYTRFIELIRGGLISDFRKLIGVSRDLPINDAAYLTAFKKNHARVLEFLHVLFNPDGKPIAIQFRELVKYHRLDGAADLLVPLIPADRLDPALKRELWNELAAKRANRHTDAFFERHIYPGLKKLDPSGRLANYEKILGYGMLRSERLLNELLTELIQKDIDALKPRASLLTDREVQPIVQQVITRVPGSSRFRDELLEHIAGELELSLSQLYKFIEPLKSFNFRAMSPLTVNLLSAVSIMLEKLKVQDKIDLVRYIQKRGSTSLREALPWVDRVSHEVDEFLRNKLNVESFDWMDHLESFVRDAGDGERLVLAELVIGSREVGLWYQGATVRDQIYEMAGLEKGSVKRRLFDGYLKALPPHEHSVTLSYLIAATREGGESELLRIIEAFDTLGDQFAQIASVLGTFGPERSKELAKAKNRARLPTRAAIYELLKEHYSVEQYAQVKRLRRLLGAGKLKYVELVEFADGSKEAVSIRRPFLDETIASTFDIVSEWAKQLAHDPGLSSEYDFDYYLTAVKEMLDQEVLFKREHALAVEMNEVYAAIDAHKGWKFKPVTPSKKRGPTDNLLHFLAVEDAVPFDQLSPEDQKAVAELIVDTELHLLLNKLRFDADRHMGNYLFDPKTKSVYALDMGQVYRLRPNGLLRAGDPYTIAQMLHGISNQDPVAGAKTLTKAFLDLAEALPETPGRVVLEADLAVAIEKVLRAGAPLQERMFQVLAELNRRRVRIPLRFSMGIVKGLTIVLNEDYAKVLDPSFVEKRLEKFVRNQLTWGARFKALERCSLLLEKPETR